VVYTNNNAKVPLLLEWEKEKKASESGNKLFYGILFNRNEEYFPGVIT